MYHSQLQKKKKKIFRRPSCSACKRFVKGGVNNVYSIFTNKHSNVANAPLKHSGVSHNPFSSSLKVQSVQQNETINPQRRLVSTKHD